MTLQEVAALVSADSAMAARVLQIVNSAFFRLARRITNIEQAVNYLGFTAIRNLAVSRRDLCAMAQRRPRGVLDLHKLQSHAHAVASVASSLTAGTLIADDTMLAGLLHDIGYWILAQECPADLHQATELAASQASRCMRPRRRSSAPPTPRSAPICWVSGACPTPSSKPSLITIARSGWRKSDFDVSGRAGGRPCACGRRRRQRFRYAPSADPRVDASYLDPSVHRSTGTRPYGVSTRDQEDSDA